MSSSVLYAPGRAWVPVEDFDMPLEFPIGLRKAEMSRLISYIPPFSILIGCIDFVIAANIAYSCVWRGQAIQDPQENTRTSVSLTARQRVYAVGVVCAVALRAMLCVACVGFIMLPLDLLADCIRRAI